MSWNIWRRSRSRIELVMKLLRVVLLSVVVSWIATQLNTTRAQSAIGITRNGTEIPVRFSVPRDKFGRGAFRVVITGGHGGEKSLIGEPREFWAALSKQVAQKPFPR